MKAMKAKVEVQKIPLWAVRIVCRKANEWPSAHQWFANKSGIDHKIRPAFQL